MTPPDKGHCPPRSSTHLQGPLHPLLQAPGTLGCHCTPGLFVSFTGPLHPLAALSAGGATAPRPSRGRAISSCRLAVHSPWSFTPERVELGKNLSIFFFLLGLSIRPLFGRALPDLGRNPLYDRVYGSLAQLQGLPALVVGHLA